MKYMRKLYSAYRTAMNVYGEAMLHGSCYQ